MSPRHRDRRRRRLAVALTIFAVFALAATVIIPVVIAIRGA